MPDLYTGPTGYEADRHARAVEIDPIGQGTPWSIDPMLAGNNANVGTANNTWYYLARGGGIITKLGVWVATSSGNICLSVYAATGTGTAKVPGKLLASTGSIACPAAGWQSVALPNAIRVKHGQHFLAIAADNTTAAFGAATSPASGALGGLMYNQGTAFPSPSTATPVSITTGRMLLVMGTPS